MNNDVRVPLVATHHGEGTFDLSIVVPAFNEAERIAPLLKALESRLDNDRSEIIVVDDGSEDQTAAVASRSGSWAKHLVIVKHDTNLGKGAAVRTGVLAARGAVVGFLDADNATDLDALSPMLEALQGRVAAVFGSRHAPGSVVVGSPAFRGVMGRVFNHVVRASSGTSISDTQCGAKFFVQGPARLAFGSAGVDGFAFDVEVLRLLLAMGFEVIEYPVRWNYMSGTKIRPLTPLRMLRDIVRVRTTVAEPELFALNTNWGEAVSAIARPLEPGRELKPGDPCAVLYLPHERAEADNAANRLNSAGLWAQVVPTKLPNIG